MTDETHYYGDGHDHAAAGQPELDVVPDLGEAMLKKPKHPKQGQLDMIVDEKICDLFDALYSEFIYIGKRAKERGEKPMKPSEIREMLKNWDLDDAFENWWYEGKTDKELAEEPWE